MRDVTFPLAGVVLACTLTVVASGHVGPAGTAPVRPQGPCDIYAASGTPCVAAHSTTRALSAAYAGPLYQVTRLSDGKTADIGVVPPVVLPVPDAGGYADAAAQDTFCANDVCLISVIYDQSGQGNHLRQAPPGPLFPGPAKGMFDTQPIADMAPITIAGHKAYGVFMMPGMGFRNNDAKGLAIDDEPEGIYYVVDGTHYDSGCCFDYGNASTNGRAVGTGTMETTYFGTSTNWGRGSGTGPWIMADMEAGLFSGYDAKLNAGTPTIDTWRFVTAVVNGGGGNRWELRGGDAQRGGLQTFYSGVRPGSLTNNAYYPMHKQGAILLGIGGDNGNGSAGTFYEGVMTAGYPSTAAVDAVQANIVAARYDVPRVTLSRALTFAPATAQEITATFTNTTGVSAGRVSLTLEAPRGWNVRVSGGDVADAAVAAGATVTRQFVVTAPTQPGAGFVTARATWTDSTTGRPGADTIAQRVRSSFPVTINEVRFGTGSNPSDQFVELYNASPAEVDVSGWILDHTPSGWTTVRLGTIPPGTTLGPGAFYLLGLSDSGLAAPAHAGDTVVRLRAVDGLAVGQDIVIDGETRTIVAVGTPAAPMTAIFAPVSTGPWISIPPGTQSVPVVNTAGFAVGQPLTIDRGGREEQATVTAVGKPGTQTTLLTAAAAGAVNIKIGATAGISVGDTLTLGTGARKEVVTVAGVGTPGDAGTGVDLRSPLTRPHRQGIDVSDPGTGITFTPPTVHLHRSGDAVQALGSGVTIDRPLARSHATGSPVVTRRAGVHGYRGQPVPQQWFGATLAARAGAIVLRDAAGTVIVDAMVYGSQQSNSSANGAITSPEIAVLEGVQRQGGCLAVVPGLAGGSGASRGRFPDGHDTDNNCTDFHVQAVTSLAAASTAAATNIKVASVADFVVGQAVVIGEGTDFESAVIAEVGTAGGTTLDAGAGPDATVLTVVSTLGFGLGQTISVDDGVNREAAVIVGVTRGGRFGPPGAPARAATITVASPLRFAYRAGASVSGSGITLREPLVRPHPGGAAVANEVPTPGGPNRYARR